MASTMESSTESGGASVEHPPDQQDPKATDTDQPKRSKSQKSRHRASVACMACRDRRIRCVVPAGDAECTQCKRSGVDCVIRNDDERRRPISRAYMSSLTDRINLLEDMLKEKGAEPPPAQHPPKTRTQTGDRGRNRGDGDSPRPNRGPPSNADQSSPGSQQDDYLDADNMEPEGSSLRGDDAESASSPSVLTPSRKEGMVSRLLSTRGHLSFDQLSGRLRYFGPTTNCHVHSELATSLEEQSMETMEQARRAEKTIRMLSIETYEYLMELFWQHYNSVIHVIHQEAFNEDREHCRMQFYSPLLHICVLAMGYRFADRNRPDMHKISLPQGESTLHREAKYMLDSELERPGGIPTITALLLLGDLECGVGRDNLGWLYGGMACRLAFDMGLHLDTRNSGLPDREVDIRQMTLWACVIYDKYWALFLGRPTSMKSSDLEVYTLSKQFERLGTCKPAGPEKSLETLIYEALLDLMELAGKITENMDRRFTSDASIDRDAYLRMAALDRELGSWYAQLPQPLKWTESNIATAPRSFFLLHQQYHSALILLHRPFAMYEDPSGSESEDSNGPDSHFSSLSRTVCTKHAIRVARIFWQHRQRFDTKQCFVTGMQHAGTAATALVAALAFIKNDADRNNNMQYLECLYAALQDMAHIYQPAERMSVVLQAVMAELRSGSGVTSTSHSHSQAHPQTATSMRRPSLVPARRGSSTVDDPESAVCFKRRQTSRPRLGSTSKSRRTASTSAGLSGNKLRQSNPNHLTSSTAVKTQDNNNNTNSGLAEIDRRSENGFIMVPPTPRSEILTSTSTWGTSGNSNANPRPSTASTTHLPSGNLSGNLPTPSSTSVRSTNAWMGAVEVDDMTHMAALASVHFPEVSSFTDGADDTADNSHLDFMNLESDDWRDWAGGMGAAAAGPGTDLDGFPPANSVGGGFGNSPFEAGTEGRGLFA